MARRTKKFDGEIPLQKRESANFDNCSVCGATKRVTSLETTQTCADCVLLILGNSESDSERVPQTQL